MRHILFIGPLKRWITYSGAYASESVQIIETYYYLLYLNNHGSRKVLQWKLDIQHHDAVIEHVPGEQNIPADVFSRLVSKQSDATSNQKLILQCKVANKGKPWVNPCTLWGWHHITHDTTLPIETSKDNWPNTSGHVRQYIQSCVTCQKMNTRNQIIRASRFVISFRCNASP